MNVKFNIIFFCNSSSIIVHILPLGTILNYSTRSSQNFKNFSQIFESFSPSFFFNYLAYHEIYNNFNIINHHSLQISFEYLKRLCCIIKLILWRKINFSHDYISSQHLEYQSVRWSQRVKKAVNFFNNDNEIKTELWVQHQPFDKHLRLSIKKIYINISKQNHCSFSPLRDSEWKS